MTFVELGSKAAKKGAPLSLQTLFNKDLENQVVISAYIGITLLKIARCDLCRDRVVPPPTISWWSPPCPAKITERSEARIQLGVRT